MVNVFFDTEFTDLLNPQLISLGFVAENQCSLYVELLDWRAADCSEFTRAVVLPLLDAPRRLSMHGAAAAIVAYIDAFAEPVTLHSDAAIDLQLLGELLHDAGGDKPGNLAAACIVALSLEGEMVREELYASTLRRHHALDDAKALLAGWAHG
jgi:hypothetical protein